MKICDKVQVLITEDVLGKWIDTSALYEITREFDDSDVGLAPFRDDHMGSLVGYFAWIVRRTDIRKWEE